MDIKDKICSFIKGGTNNMSINKQDISNFKLSIVGYVLICVASSGFYQRKFWGNEAPAWLWIALALLGSIFLLLKEINHYKEHQRLLLTLDLSFIIPVIVIPMIPIRHDFSLIIMLVYGIGYILTYILSYYKKNH